MSLDVGELVARLTVDDSRYIQGMRNASQASEQVGQAAQDAARTVQRATDDQGRAYQNLTREVQRNETAATQARQRSAVAAEAAQTAERRLQQVQERSGSTADEVAAAERQLAQARQNATRALDRAQAAADTYEAAQRQAAQATERLGQSAQQADRDVQQLGQNSDEAARGVSRIGEAAGSAVSGMARVGGAVSSRAGHNTAGSFISGFADKLGDLSSKTGPVAGSILGIAVLGLAAGAALAAAIQDGLQSEMDRDLFQAQTGVTNAQAHKFATAAGESFADAFGQSVNDNLSTTKVALQNGLLDPGSTQRDAEAMINSLSGVSDILGEEIPAVAAAAGHALKTGFAYDAQDAFDLIVKGSQMGLNVSEDWLDTINEYGVQFKKLGLSGADSIGLMSQALKAGARDTDITADALKEFSIRAIDGSKLSAEGFAALAYEQDGAAASQEQLIENNGKMMDGFGKLGFNAEEMTEKISKGGESAREGLGQVLDKLRGIEDPAERAAAATALFGTQSEDLGDALFAMDLDTATQGLNDYEGAAQRAINIMGGNAGTSIQGAMNSIQLASDGFKAALADAFGPYIQKFADYISNNRAGVIQFFIDVGNAVFEGGKSVLTFVEGGMRGLAEFSQAGTDMSVSFLRSLADMTEGISGISSVLSLVIPGFGAAFGDLGDVSGKLNAMADSAEKVGNGVADGLNKGADTVRDTLIPALGEAQDQFNMTAQAMRESAAFNDASTKLGKAIGEIGVGADGSAIKIENWTGAIDRNNAAQVQMEKGITGLKAGLQDQIKAGLEAGVTVEGLTQQYDENCGALIDQLIATGMNNKEALNYINTLGLTPELAQTLITQPGMPEATRALDILKGKIIDVPDEKTVHTQALTKDAEDALTTLGYTVEHLPDGTVRVTAPTDAAEHQLQEFLQRERNIKVGVYPTIMEARTAQGVPANFQGPVNYLNPNGQANGSVMAGSFANGGMNRLPDMATIMSPRANLIQWAEPETGGEAFIPLALSKRARSEDILAEVAHRFGKQLVDAETAKIFRGDPKSLTDETDPTGWRALLGGDYNGKLRKFGIEEDHPFVNAVLGARSVINDGAFDERLRLGTGMEEDHPLVGALMDFHKFTAQENKKLALSDLAKQMGFGAMSFADGGITGGGTPFNGQAAIEFFKAHNGEPYQYGALDCSGLLSAGFNKATGQNVRFTTDSDFAALGWKPGYDPNGYSIGTNGGVGENGHMAGAIYGTNVESDGSNGIQYGGSADGPLDFPEVWHWPGAGGGNPTKEDVDNALKNGLGDLGPGAVGGSTSSGVTAATDGQRVFVTNWPGSYDSKPTTSDSPSAPAPADSKSETIWSAGIKIRANGGIDNLPSQAGIQRGTVYQYGEPETGGEAFIPLGSSKRPRSVALTRQVANRFGYELVPMADGGLGGFGGYTGHNDKPTLDIPLTAGGLAGMTANQRRAAMYNLASLGVGGAFAVASGFDENGQFTGQFDTGANSHPALEKGFDQIAQILEEIRKAAEEGKTVNVKVDVDQNSGMANLAITKMGL